MTSGGSTVTRSPGEFLRSLLGRRVGGVVPSGLLIGGCLALCASSAIHFYLWDIAYRDVATLGPLFLFQGSAAASLAVLDAVTRRVPALVLSALFLVSTIGGFVLATTVGLFGFTLHEITGWAVGSVVAEALGTLLLLGASTLAWPGSRDRGAPVADR